MQQNPLNAPSAYWPTQRGPANTLTSHQQTSYDVAIIGDGIMGLLTALILSTKGKKVCVIDKGVIGNEAAGNNGGMVLDLMEGSPIKTAQRYRTKLGIIITRKILEISRRSVDDMTHLHRDYGVETDFQKIGYVTAGKDEADQHQFAQSHRFVSKLLPKLYDLKKLLFLSRDEIGSPVFIGGIFSKNGGIYNPAKTMTSLLKLLSSKRVRIFENTEIIHLEAGTKSSVDITASSGHAMNAKTVVLAGGGSYNLLNWVKDFTKPCPVVTGMIATSPLPEALYVRMANGAKTEVPVQGSQTYGPPYWRFELLDNGQKRLLFGSGARAGTHEYKFI